MKKPIESATACRCSLDRSPARKKRNRAGGSREPRSDHAEFKTIRLDDCRTNTDLVV
jgi:hypothetical protein